MTSLIVNEEPLDQKMFHVKKLTEYEKELEENENTLIQSTYIANPVKYTIDISIHPVKSKIEFK